MQQSTRYPAQKISYDGQLDLARQHARRAEWERAVGELRRAITLDPSRPEAYNLLGAFEEILGDLEGAERSYRVACDLDPGYEPSRHNLDRMARLRAGDTGDIWIT